MKNTIKKLLAGALLAIPACHIYSAQQFSQINEKQLLKKDNITYTAYQNMLQTLTNNMNDNDVMAIF